MTSDIAKALTREDLAAMISEAIKRASDPLDYHQDALYHLKGILRETPRESARSAGAESIAVNMPFERLPQHGRDPGFGPVPPRPKVEQLFQYPETAPGPAPPISRDHENGRAPSAPQGELRGGDAFVPLWDIDRGGPHPAGHRVRVWLPDGSYIGGRRVSAQRAGGCACSLSDDGEEILEWCSVHAAARDRTPPLGGTAGATELLERAYTLIEIDPETDVVGSDAWVLRHQIDLWLHPEKGPLASATPPAPSVERPNRLAKLLRETTERMANVCAVDMTTWQEHSRAALDAADLIDRLTSRPAVLGGEDALMKAVRALLENEFIVDSVGLTNDYITLLTEYDILRRLHSPAPVEGPNG